MLGKSDCIDFEGVRINPSKLTFRHAYEGKTFREKITFQNISTKSVIISTKFEQLNCFNVENHLQRIKLSCGLYVMVWINYTHTYSAVNTAILMVYVNGKPYQLQINVTMASAHIECQPNVLNFGTINMGYAVHVRKLTLSNKGHKQTKFDFDIFHNVLGLSLSPQKGFIPGMDSIEVEVHLIGIEEGIFYKDIWIKCDHPFRFSVSVEVIKPRLYISSPHDYTESFFPIMFPPIYGGCKYVQSFSIFNYNMLDTTYIIVPEINFNVMALHKVQEFDPAYKTFFFSPIEGNLKTLETRDLRISFEPSKKQAHQETVFFVCYRLIRLECLAVDGIANQQQKQPTYEESKEYSASNISLGKIDSKSEITDSNIDFNLDKISMTSEMLMERKTSFDKYIRLCLYGVVKPLRIEVEPYQFTIKKIQIHSKTEDTLIIYNKSNYLPIIFQDDKCGYASIEPTKGFIPSMQCFKLKVIFAPKAGGFIDTPLRINFFHYNYIQEKDIKKQLQMVGFVDIPVSMQVEFSSGSASKYGKTKFNLGITPKITNEVGLLTDDVRFNSNVEKPRMAMLDVYKSKPWKKFDNAKISFPNDRPTTLQSWRNKDVKCKTIFADVPRALVLTDEYTLTSIEKLRKSQNDNYYLNYIRKSQRNRSAKYSDNNHADDYQDCEKKLLQKLPAINCAQYKTTSNASVANFSELKPIQTFFVQISPSKLEIGKVVEHSSVIYKIEITNDNKFAVRVCITSFHADKRILPELPDVFIVAPSSTVIKEMTFSPKHVGIFNTILNVYINTCYLRPILFHAEVVKPTVTVDKNEIIFDDRNHDAIQIVPVRNNLNIPVVFSWHIPESCYSVRPSQGTIPPGRYIACEVYYIPNFTKKSVTNITINCHGGTPVHIEVNCCIIKHNVAFINGKIEVPNVPINILTVRKNILRNYSDKTVLFTIKNRKLFNFLTVEPESGSIRGRSDANIFVKICATNFIKFECKIEVELENSNHLSFLVVGSVDFPLIAYKPEKPIQVRRVPAQSFEIVPFSVKNKGTSDVYLSFPKNPYPEVTISGSKYVDIPLDSNTKFLLSEGQTVQLYFHFYPLDVGMNDFYLPVVINNILGPPVKEDILSLLPKFYIKDVDYSSSDDSSVELIDYKIKLPYINFSTISSRHILRLSKTTIKFKYFPTLPSWSITYGEIKIKNSTVKTVEFCIQIMNLSQSFEVTGKPSEYICYRDDECIGIKLDEGEEITLGFQYIPRAPDIYMINMPVFVKEFSKDIVYNYIKLRVIHHAPTFESPRWVFIEPVPLDVLIIRDMELNLLNHEKDCEVQITCGLEQAEIHIFQIDDDVDKPYQKVLHVRIQFRSAYPISICKRVNFECSCGVEYFIIIGFSAEEDILSIYTHYYAPIPNECVIKSRGYPYFVEDSDISEFAMYMRKCVTVVEKWLFQQMFHLSLYYNLPESMTGFYQNISDKPKRKGAAKLVLAKILSDICGYDIVPLPSENEIENDLDRINYIHCSNVFMLMFLSRQGAYIPHVRSRYLLSYPDYVIYLNKIRPKKNKALHEPKTEKLYYRRSKQCWLDLMIQIFKTMILARVSVKRSRSTRISLVIRESVTTYVLNLSPQQSLLAWLQTVYNQRQDSVLQLKSDNFLPGARSITNFTTDLSDCIVLIVVTIHFCPYLIPYIQDIYIEVDTYEKAFHNAVILTEVWKMINCSFKITPLEIVEPMAIQMLFLVYYIYDVFQSFAPKEDLHFTAGLTLSTEKEIIIRNPNSCELFYEIKFLNNALNCFSTSTNKTIKILPGKAYKLKVIYKAKFIETQSVVLLLCGDFPEQMYSRSIVYSLIGESNFLGEHPHIVLQVNLYQLSTSNIEVHSPYPGSATYDISYAKIKPNEVTPDKLIPMKLEVSSAKPRTIHTMKTKITVNKTGHGIIDITLCSLSTEILETTLFFCNKSVGDFYMHITVEPVNFDNIETIPLHIDSPGNWEDLKCTCGLNKFINPLKCPRNVILHIPCKNDKFWNVVSKSILLNVPENETSIWKKYLENEMGPHMLRWLTLGETGVELKSVQHMFSSNITYMVINKHKSIKLPETVTIPNVRSSGSVDMYMHVSDDVKKLTGIVISLQTEDRTELRKYSLAFKKSFTDYDNLSIQNESNIHM